METRKEQGPEMFGGRGMLTMGLTAIFLLSLFLIQTRARYEEIFVFISKGYKVETNVVDVY